MKPDTIARIIGMTGAAMMLMTSQYKRGGWVGCLIIGVVAFTIMYYGVYKSSKNEVNENNNTDIDIEDIPPISKVHSEKSFQVGYSDIDTNMQVNNVKYIGLALETVPKDISLNYQLKNIKATYEKETTYGETITVSTEVIRQEGKIICRQKITNEEGTTLTLLESVWA